MALVIVVAFSLLFFQVKCESECKGIYKGDDEDFAIFPLDVCMLTASGGSFIRQCIADNSDVLEIYYSSSACMGEIVSSNTFDVSKYSLSAEKATYYCNATENCDYALITVYNGCEETNDQTVDMQASVITNECIPLSSTTEIISEYPELNLNDSSVQYVCNDAVAVYVAVYDNAECNDPNYDYLLDTFTNIECASKNATHFYSQSVECSSAAYPSSKPTTSPTRDCAKPNAAEITCDWYLECLEQWKQCGNDGYAIDYGYYYCSRYEQFIDQFTVEGNQWVYQVMECLQNSLVPLLSKEADKNTCEYIHSFAFETHPNCYVNGAISVCEVWRDWLTILKTVFSGLLSMEGGKQMFDTLFMCKNFYKWKGKMILEGVFDEFEDALQEAGEGAVDWVYDVFKKNLKDYLYKKLFVNKVFAGSVVIEFAIISESDDVVNALDEAFSVLLGTEITVGNGTNSTKLTFTSMQLWENFTETTTTEIVVTTTEEPQTDFAFMRFCSFAVMISFLMLIITG